MHFHKRILEWQVAHPNMSVTRDMSGLCTR